MPEIDQGGVELRGVFPHVPLAPQNPPLLQLGQAGQRTQQRGLAGAIGTGHLQHLAGEGREADPPQHMTVAPPQVHIVRAQTELTHHPT